MFQLRREVILAFINSKSEITGGEDKVVKIDKSKFRERKYQWGHKVKGQQVFGGIDYSRSQKTVVSAMHHYNQ